MPPAHACNACKRRKVKCDGAEPCSNCRLSRLRCGYNGLSTRRSRGVHSVHSVHSVHGFHGVLRESPSPPTGTDADRPGPPGPPGPPGDGHHAGYIHPAPGITPANHLQQAPRHGQQYSPQSLLTPSSTSTVLFNPGSGESGPSFCFFYDAGHIHSALLAGVGALLAPEPILDVVHGCIDFFVQYLFPNTPVAHEPTLRAAAALLTAESLPTFADWSSFSSDTHQQISCLRKFALVTALCAFVMSVSPERAPAQRALLSVPFLSASRAMLRVYEEYDLEHPDSTSLTIRMWHSAAMQNTTGRVGTSYQYHAEAGFLAQRLRLYDERSVQQHSKIESQLLRSSFWLLYLADKTCTALETRPPVFNEAVFDADFTLLENSDHEEPLLDASRKVNQADLESRLFLGFHLKRRIWTAAADLLANIKSFSHSKIHGTMQSADKDTELTRLAEAYLLFTSLTDHLPAWLRNPDTSISSDDEEVVSYQKTCFWTQRSNIMTVFHCMRLVILQKCIDNDMHAIIGLNEHIMSLAIRKIEIVRDFLHELQIVPFFCFKVQGETAVERIRRVGTILLELVDNAENETIERVARSQFENLLDLLAQLDSKASDELAGGLV